MNSRSLHFEETKLVRTLDSNRRGFVPRRYLIRAGLEQGKGLFGVELARLDLGTLYAFCAGFVADGRFTRMYQELATF